MEVFAVAEETFGCFVESFRDVIESVWCSIARVFEFAYGMINMCGDERNILLKHVPSRNSRARRDTNTDPAKIQSGGAISSITRGDAPLMAYALISRVPPPASAIKKPCFEGFYSNENRYFLFDQQRVE